MQRDIEQRHTATVVQTAAETLLSQRQRLGDLLEQVRRKHREHLQRLREVEQSLQETGQRLDRSDASLDTQISTDRTLELAALRERHELLRQQQRWLAERLIDLSSAARRIQTVIRQSQLSVDYLLGDVESEADSVDPLADLGQLRALEVREEERQRLAREVHDGPAQVLANAIFQIEFCQRLAEKDPRRLDGELGRLKGDLRESLAEVRYFIFDLRPGPLAELGLVATMRRYAEGYQSRSGIAVHLDLDDDLQRLSTAKEMAIFRVVQEALQNTRKHSGASRVDLIVRQEGDHLLVSVEDDGRGFDADAAPGGGPRHFGLVSMQERAQLIRGDLQIESEVGHGTRVTLRVPLSQSREL